MFLLPFSFDSAGIITDSLPFCLDYTGTVPVIKGVFQIVKPVFDHRITKAGIRHMKAMKN